MTTRSSFRWYFVAGLTPPLLLAASCGAGGEQAAEQLEASGDPAAQEQVVPDTLREIGVPVAVSGVALGADHVLTQARQAGGPSSYSVVNIDTGETSPVDAPSADEGAFTSLLSFGDDAIAWMKRCPEYSEDDLDDNRRTCAPGFDGINVQLFESDRREWVDVGLFTPGELAMEDPTTLTVTDLGVSGNSIYLLTRSGGQPNVAEIQVPERRVDVVQPRPPDGTSVMCVTASGALVGSTVERADSDGDIYPDEPRDPLLGVLAVLEADAGEWAFHDDVSISNAWQQIGCGSDSVSIVGLPAEGATETTWREVSLEGALMSNQVLEGLPPADFPVTDTLFGRGTNSLGFVREMSPGESTRTGEGILDYDVEIFRTVILVPGPDLPPLVLHDRDESEGSMGRGAVLTDGSIVVFDNTEADPRIVVAE